MREGSDTEVPHEKETAMMHHEDPLQGSAESWAASSPQWPWEHGVEPAIELNAEGEGGLGEPGVGDPRPLPVTRGNRPASSISTGTTDLNDEVAQTMARVGGGELSFLPTPRIRFAGTLRIPCWHSKERSANLELLERR